ncbi:hypothetical protein [Phytohabitans houttuyneae]|uniref:Uncharacterized protein n=1 Tax=Phytohabitans houttuyneae TaxID=1076126 RepID=A0A6V8KHS2_9ACTN|nr:hypothetical protein [Phytohabitans houttuyneae]GFJ81257.1 hypothetical protein Phou_054370 [Phytohabitans houttuyneae]
MTALTVVMAAALVVGSWPLAMMHRAERIMRGTGGPGIVPFELAESPREADRYMRAWGTTGRRAARQSIHWDFPFIAVYVTLLAAAALHVADRADAAGYSVLLVIAWGAAILAVAAGVLDVVENVVLLRTLSEHDGVHAVPRGRIRVARLCAQVKFAFVSVVGVAVLAGFGIVQLSRHPTSDATVLALLIATGVAAGVFTLLIRRRPRPQQPSVPETTGLAESQ